VRRAALVLAVVCGCSPGWRDRIGMPERNPSAADALTEADRAALSGRPRDAVSRYEAIVREHPSDAAAAEALHRLAMLRLDPSSPIHDRKAAGSLLRRLATEHPNTLPGREARAWRSMVRDLDRCEAEATRTEADNEKLRQTLESIKDSDLELEQRP
jgi:hypothetical protein